MFPLNRRHFLRLGLSSGIAYLSAQPLARAAGFRARGLGHPAEMPLRGVVGGFANSRFNGDDPARVHERIWDVANYVRARGGRPPVSERRDVVVVGGGMAGLSSAYFLRSKRPLLLEQDFQFGGNSRGEVFGDTPFSIGAAYITVPEAGSPVDQMLKATGLFRAARTEQEHEARVHFRGRGFVSLWGGQADPATAAIAARVAADLGNIAENDYPNIPWEPGGMSRAAVDQLDGMTFLDWLQRRYGPLPTAIVEYFQLYCWSSFAGSIEEISAAQALNFLAAETGGIIAFPGGNSAIAQGLHQFLKRELGDDSVRGGSFVLEVRPVDGGVEILLETPQGALQTIFCRACVFAAPKYVAKSLVHGLNEQQIRLSSDLNYRAYIVANVLLNARVASPAFDTYCLEGEVPPAPGPSRPSRRAFTDVCFANWAAFDRGSRSILTLYKPYPYEGSKAHLLNENAFGKIHQQVTEGLGEILQTLGVPTSAISGVRLTRWGHALPLARPGFLAKHADEVFARPVAGRIFFANQDNFANPSFESAFSAAERAASGALQLF